MKGLAAILGVCSLLAMVDLAIAKERPEGYDLATDIQLLRCNTTADKIIRVGRNPVTDIITILYGDDLRKPEKVVALPANNMGTSYRSSTAEGVENREIYAAVGTTFTTVGMQDRQGKKTGYISVMASGQQTLVDDCADETVASMFLDHPEHFQSFTDVD